MRRSKGFHSARDSIALTVLGLLFEQPRHPYEMQRLMRERHKDFAIGKTRSFYDVVALLREKGFVVAAGTNREGKHPERTVYLLTDLGREEYVSWLLDLLATPAVEYPAFTIALNFAGSLAPGRVALALRSREATLAGTLAHLVTTRQALLEHVGLPRIVLLELEHTEALCRAEREWVQGVIADIESGSLWWPAPPVAGDGGIASPWALAAGNQTAAVSHVTDPGGSMRTKGGQADD